MRAVAILLLSMFLLYVGITGRTEAVWYALTRPQVTRATAARR